MNTLAEVARPEAVALVPSYMLPARWIRYDVLPARAARKENGN